MKFYILKDQLIRLAKTIHDEDEDDYPYVERSGTYKITDVIPFRKGPVANQICKQLTDVLNLTASSKDGSGCSSSKRSRLSDQDQGLASLDFELGYHSCKKHILFDGKVTGLIEHFEKFLRVPPENINMKFRGSLKFEETGEIGDTSNTLNCFASLVTRDQELTKRRSGSYGFLESLALKADRSNWNSELSPRKLLEKVNLALTGIFTVTLTVDGVNKEFFMDKDIGDKMSIPKKLLNEEVDCDIKIILDNGQVIRCHKAFLSAHSQVFASMLNGNFVEGATKQIKLPGKSEEAIRALLAYLYHWDTSALCADPWIAVQLFKIGDANS